MCKLPGDQERKGGFAWKGVPGNKVAEEKLGLEGGAEEGSLEQILWASPALPFLVEEVSRFQRVQSRD